MRRLAGLAVSLVLAACSSSHEESSSADAGGGQALGTPCNPALPHPCEEVTDVCSVAECDLTLLTCVRVAVEAGPLCGNGVPPADDAGALVDGERDGETDASDATVATDAPEGDAFDASVSDAPEGGPLDGGADAPALDGGGDASDAAGTSSSDGGAPDADAVGE
jgi:hypothetical protein